VDDDVDVARHIMRIRPSKGEMVSEELINYVFDCCII